MINNVKQKGQVIIVLLLVMVITLAVALSIIGRSINEISTSTKTEDSTRAFSAAEAGIEKVLKLAAPPGSPVPLSFNNRASAIAELYDLPEANKALEHPRIGKASFAQFWFARPDINYSNGLPVGYYATSSARGDPTTFDVYFGIPSAEYNYIANLADKPAIEVDTIVWSATSTPRFESRRSWFDTANVGERTNNFQRCNDAPNELSPAAINTNHDTMSSFYCKVTVDYAKSDSIATDSGGIYPIMARIRILYSGINHPVAIKPNGTRSLPPQAKIYESSGSAGQVQRNLQVFRQKEVVPHFFDFVLFSEAEIKK